MVCARTSAHRMLRNVRSIYTYIGAWFCSFIQEPGEPKPVQSAPLETAPSLESPPQELDVVQYMSCTCVQRIFCIFAAVFGISISSLVVFRPPTIPQHQHQEVAALVQQSGEVEANEEELEFVLRAKSWCVRELLHLECLVSALLVHGFADSYTIYIYICSQLWLFGSGNAFFFNFWGSNSNSLC